MTTVYNDYNAPIPESDIKEQGEFITLEPGEYGGFVAKREFGNFEPKPHHTAPACKTVEVTVAIEKDGQKAYVKERFMLYSDMAWKIKQFFVSVGLAEHGKEFVMNWDKAVGRKCRVKITKTAGKKEGTWFNNIDKFLDAQAAAMQSPPAPAPQGPEQEEIDVEDIPF